MWRSLRLGLGDAATALVLRLGALVVHEILEVVTLGLDDDRSILGDHGGVQTVDVHVGLHLLDREGLGRPQHDLGVIEPATLGGGSGGRDRAAPSNTVHRLIRAAGSLELAKGY